MVTIAEIKEDRRGRGIHSQWHKLVYYPIANYLIWLCIKLGISADLITWLSFIAGMSGCVLIAFGSHLMLIIGVLLVILRDILDCTDGWVARLTGTTSRYGQFLDVGFGYVWISLVPLCMGLSLYFKTDMWLYLIIGGVCAVSWLLGSALILLYNKVFTEEFRTIGSSKMEKWHILLPEVLVLLVCAVFNYLEAYLILFTMIYVGRVLAIMYGIRKKAKG